MGRAAIGCQHGGLILATGTVSQVCDVLLKAASFPLYVWIYEHARLFELSHRPLLHWALALVGVDFFYYFWHRASHEMRVLWAIHAVHHQSEDMNLGVALRQPAFQGPTVVLFFLPLALLGVDKLELIGARLSADTTQFCGKLGIVVGQDCELRDEKVTLCTDHDE